MVLIPTKKYSKDLRNVKNKKLRDTVDAILTSLENVDSLKDFPNLKKMQGYKNKYRIKVNKHRLGLTLLDANTIEINHFKKREDIYKFFPVLFSW